MTILSLPPINMDSWTVHCKFALHSSAHQLFSSTLSSTLPRSHYRSLTCLRKLSVHPPPLRELPVLLIASDLYFGNFSPTRLSRSLSRRWILNGKKTNGGSSLVLNVSAVAGWKGKRRWEWSPQKHNPPDGISLEWLETVTASFLLWVFSSQELKKTTWKWEKLLWNILWASTVLGTTCNYHRCTRTTHGEHKQKS